MPDPDRQVPGPDGLALTCAGTGPGVLWVHGYTMDSLVWRDLWPLLPGYRHLGLDLPWHGGSRPLHPGETLADLADLIAAWCVGPAGAGPGSGWSVDHVVGLSFGTVVVLELLLRHPGLVRSAVLAAPSAAGAWPDPDAERRYREVLAAYRVHGPGQVLTDLWMRPGPDIFTAALRRPRVAQLLVSRVERHAWGELEAGGLQPLLTVPQRVEDVARSNARVLVLIGEHELPAHRAVAAGLAAAGARACLVDGAGHLPLLEEPAAVAPLLREHWSNREHTVTH